MYFLSAASLIKYTPRTEAIIVLLGFLKNVYVAETVNAYRKLEVIIESHR